MKGSIKIKSVKVGKRSCKVMGDLDCCLFDFAALKKWFWEEEKYKDFPVFGPLPTINGTTGRVVSIAAARQAVTPCSWRVTACRPT